MEVRYIVVDGVGAMLSYSGRVLREDIEVEVHSQLKMQMTLEMLDQAVGATYEVNSPGIYIYDDFLIYNQIPWYTTTDL